MSHNRPIKTLLVTGIRAFALALRRETPKPGPERDSEQTARSTAREDS